MYFPCSGWIN